MQQPLHIIRGTTQTVKITVKTTGGADYTLADGEVLRFGVKRDPSDKEFVIEKELTSAHYDSGVYVLTINPADTAELDFGEYHYDVGLQVGSNYYNVIECSTFSVEYNVTGSEVTA